MSPKEFASRIGVSVKTLQRWDVSGKLTAHRTPTNRRFYTEDQYKKVMNIGEDDDTRKNVIYACVSSTGQKDDLKNQVEFLKTYCNANGVIINDVITDIGSGLNYNRKKWNELLDEVISGKIDKIYIAFPDRFIRFGFDWFKQFCEKFDTKIIVVNNDKYSPEQELTEDLINIIDDFSYRSSEIRKYRKGLKDDKNASG